MIEPERMNNYRLYLEREDERRRREYREHVIKYEGRPMPRHMLNWFDKQGITPPNGGVITCREDWAKWMGDEPFPIEASLPSSVIPRQFIFKDGKRIGLVSEPEIKPPSAPLAIRPVEDRSRPSERPLES